MRSASNAARGPFGGQLGAAALTAALVGALAVVPAALAAAPAGAPYTDIAGNANASAITFLAAQGVVTGYPNGTYLPGNTISRAEFAALVVRLLGPKAQAAAVALGNTTPQFTDAASIPTWAWGYVNYAQGQGLVTGYPDHTFRANDPVTMVEAGAVLERAIGDAAAVPSGTYPSDYTLAAYNLNLVQGVTFVANLPATRADVAQMAYDAALLAPTLQNGYASGTPTGAPLDLGGNGFPQTAWTGTVSGVTSSSIALENAQGASVLSVPLAAEYYLFGASDVTTLQGLQATVAVNAQDQADFIQAAAGTQSKTGTLADASVSTPAGYNRVGDFLVQESTGSSLLLSNGSLIPLLSTASNGGTSFYLNAPTAGAASDTHSLVSGASNLNDGDQVTVTVGGSGQAVAIYAVHDTAPAGVVSAVNTTASTLSYTTGAADNVTTTVTVQSWSGVTLNGAVSSLSALQKGDIVDVQIVGGGNGGDTNARSIVDTRQTVSGTISAVTTQTSASGSTAQLSITNSAGQTTTVSEDSSFDGAGNPLSIGTAVMLVLDGQGHARLAQALSAQQTVVLVTGVQTELNSSGTYRQIVVDNAGTTDTYDLGVSAPLPAQPNSNGYLAVITFEPGTTTAASVSALTQAMPSSTLHVVNDDGNYLLLQQYNSANQPVGSPLVVSASSGAVLYKGTTHEAFSALSTGQLVTLWSGPDGTYLGIRE